MDLDTIRAFLAVADGHTVTETAERAHRTQPAVSRALARLEREIGTPLLQRVGRGLVLTPAGHELVRHARDTLEATLTGLRTGFEATVSAVACPVNAETTNQPTRPSAPRDPGSGESLSS